MAGPQIAPYGSWRSPISADMVTAGTLRLEQLHLDGSEIYWTESRPTEGGRSVLVRAAATGETTDITPAPYNARTRVHEYGGGSYTVVAGVIFFINFADQHLYRVDPGQEPRAIFAERKIRHADFAADRQNNRLICVREDHNVPEGEQPRNSLVSIDMESGKSSLLAEGNDFYSTPRLSPDGRQLAWLTWNHPNMPWDGTELWLADIAPDGALISPRMVAGGEAESIFQPQWSPDSVLHFASDRTGWWNLYRLENGERLPLSPMEAEFGVPGWVFGASTYGFASAERILCTYSRDGVGHLAWLDIPSRSLRLIDLPYTYYSGLRVNGEQAVFAAGTPQSPAGFVRLDLATGSAAMLRPSSSVSVDPAYLSNPLPVAFPTENGLKAYALFYPPANPDFRAPAGEKPPLIVKSHGGPTGAADAVFNLSTQYWTSRGIAVVDVNYGGSVGYGRAYRNRLWSNWGIVDVQDCANAARYLAGTGAVDGERLAIVGGSAGGYTTLAALTFTDHFRAGVSLYGIGDLELLAAHTHKFESRYLDRLVGPYPEAKETYRARSPIHFTDRLSCPVLFFQGLDDKVVPPEQAEVMVGALRAKGLPVAYVAFEGEGHGFRKAENNRRVLEDQLSFYGQIFGFTPAGDLRPLVVENL